MSDVFSGSVKHLSSGSEINNFVKKSGNLTHSYIELTIGMIATYSQKISHHFAMQ